MYAVVSPTSCPATDGCSNRSTKPRSPIATSCTRAPSSTYFALSIRGQMTDSTRTPRLQRADEKMADAATEEPRGDHRWLEAAACVPCFELAVHGTVRV